MKGDIVLYENFLLEDSGDVLSFVMRVRWASEELGRSFWKEFVASEEFLRPLNACLLGDLLFPYFAFLGASEIEWEMSTI